MSPELEENLNKTAPAQPVRLSTQAGQRVRTDL